MNLILSRGLNITLLLIISALLVFGYLLYDISFYRHHHLTGWLLFYLILAQWLYLVQKRSERIRKWLNIRWLSLHTDFGVVSILILLVHISWSTPDGSLGVLLILSFIGVAITGFIGLRIKRKYQDALAIRSGREIDFDEIPARLQALDQEANALILDCAMKHKSSMLVDYYQRWLSGQLATPGNVIAQLTGNNQAWLEHFGNLERLLPYLDSDEAKSTRELLRLLRKKTNLDYHYAHQGALRIWLLLHIPFAVCLLVFAVLHLVLVYAFSGGA